MSSEKTKKKGYLYFGSRLVKVVELREGQGFEYNVLVRHADFIPKAKLQKEGTDNIEAPAPYFELVFRPDDLPAPPNIIRFQFDGVRPHD